MPTGTLEFLDGIVSLGKLPVVNGAASMLTNALAPGNHTITARYSGDTNFVGSSSSFAQTILNVAPAVQPITWKSAGSAITPGDGIKVGTALSATANFSDAGAMDVHTASFSWGDGGTSAGTVAETNGSGSVTANHIYAAAGIYTVTLTANDNYGGSTTVQFQYVVIYDPAAGYESGAGSINSPTGSYTANVSLGGTAIISNVFARYGTDGTLSALSNTFKFSYSTAGLSFNSSSMKWLVMSGNNSWLKGEGNNVVNGASEACYFLLAIANSTSSTVADKARVKIWSKATGRVIYDNQKDSTGASAPDDATASVPSPMGPGLVTFSH